jgi:hypothetical protein
MKQTEKTVIWLFFWQFWGWNSELLTCKARVLPLETLFQPSVIFYHGTFTLLLIFKISFNFNHHQRDFLWFFFFLEPHEILHARQVFHLLQSPHFLTLSQNPFVPYSFSSSNYTCIM